ncbi:MAG: hypothetical protein J6I31_09215 [Prevotella sp.]|nr:hypothetical protein [Prevotella sp.]
MKRLIYIMFALALCACNGKRQGHSEYDPVAVSRGADSINAARFIKAIRDGGFWAQLEFDRQHLIIGTDTTGMVKSVDSLARDFHRLAAEQGVKVRRCTVIDFRTKDTLAVYE